MGFRPLAQTSHAPCEDASLKFLIFSIDVAHELVLPTQSSPASAVQQVEPTPSTTQGKRTSDKNHRSASYYGFNSSSSDSTIAAPPKLPHRAGDKENFQPPLHRLSKQCSKSLFNSLKRPKFLRLSERFRHLIR